MSTDPYLLIRKMGQVDERRRGSTESMTLAVNSYAFCRGSKGSYVIARPLRPSQWNGVRKYRQLESKTSECASGRILLRNCMNIADQMLSLTFFLCIHFPGADS